MGFSEITNASDFKGWVVGFYGEQSKALAGVANMIADAQTAKWQARCQQKADEGTQRDLTLIETQLNWPAGGAGNSADGVCIIYFARS